MDIRALLFDINSTLIDIETNEGMEEIYRAIAHFLAYQGIDLRRWQVRELYFQIMKEQFEASKEPYPEFDVVAVWREVLKRNATDYTGSLPRAKLDQLPLFLAELQRGISRKRLCPFPQVLDVLSQLKQRYRMAVVSDAQTVWAISELTSAGLHDIFHPIIISGDYGYRKPDSRLFTAALDELQVSASQALFIGNDPYRDIFGAHQVGMKAILFCPSQSPGQANIAEPDYIIRNFGELPAALAYFTAL